MENAPGNVLFGQVFYLNSQSIVSGNTLSHLFFSEAVAVDSSANIVCVYISYKSKQVELFVFKTFLQTSFLKFYQRI